MWAVVFDDRSSPPRVSRLARYENIDVHIGRPPPVLDTTASAERLARAQRGGYCFLLVGAFASLLHTLGFCVSLHTAAVGDDPPPRLSWHSPFPFPHPSSHPTRLVRMRVGPLSRKQQRPHPDLS